MLRLNGLRKSFGSIDAVDGLTLEIRRGEVFGLLGPNGAGKSTTISLCMGLLQPDSGSVELEGRGSPVEPRVRAHLGMAPQSLALYDDLTAIENLVFFGRLYEIPAPRARAEELLELVGLKERGRDRTKTFSGGMKRRLNLAVALVHKPEIVLLDEPTAGVDPQSRANILEMVRALAGTGITIVYTTHYMEEAQRVCDRVGIIDHGKMLALGTVPELIKRHGGMATVTIERGDAEERISTHDPLSVIAKVLASGGANGASTRGGPGGPGGPGRADVRGGPGGSGSADARGEATGVRVERPDLESVFLSLTGRSLRD